VTQFPDSRSGLIGPHLNPHHAGADLARVVAVSPTIPMRLRARKRGAPGVLADQDAPLRQLPERRRAARLELDPLGAAGRLRSAIWRPGRSRNRR